MIKISVITVVKDEPVGLDKTIKSVRAAKQSSSVPIEYIIVDGLSQKPTLDVIKNNSDIVDKFVSEKDAGLYDAMNKSAHLASSDNFLIWINAGDLFLAPDSLVSGIDESKTDVIFCAVKYPNGIIIFPDIRLPYNAKNFFPRTTFRHQGFLIRKEAFIQLTGYNLSLGMQADGELMSRAVARLRWQESKNVTAVFDLTGMSSQLPQRALVSYLKIWSHCGYSAKDLVRYHWWYILKLLIRVSLPPRVQMAIMKIKRGKLEA